MSSELPKTIVFFGNELLATGVTTSAPTLTALLTAGYQVAAVVTRNDAGASRKQRQLTVVDIAQQHGIPVLMPAKPAEISDQLRELGASIGVLAAYGRIIPAEIIDLFPGGILNIHPSALPKHRGTTPIESVILDGSTETAVSVMGLVPAMDAGPVYAQAVVPLDGTESKQSLVDSLGALGSRLMLEVLNDVFAGKAAPVAQEEAAATFDQRITKQAGILDFAKPATQLEREVRAYLGWPGSRTMLGNRDVVISQAHVIEGNGTPSTVWHDGKIFGIHTIDGILVIDSLKPAGKAEMTAEAFVAGYGRDL